MASSTTSVTPGCVPALALGEVSVALERQQAIDAFGAAQVLNAGLLEPHIRVAGFHFRPACVLADPNRTRHERMAETA